MRKLNFQGEKMGNQFNYWILNILLLKPHSDLHFLYFTVNDHHFEIGEDGAEMHHVKKK